MESQPRLLDQMREVLRLKHLSFRTEKTYIGWVKRFILFHDKRHPKDMGAAEIRAFLSYLATHEHVAASTQNGALNALLFLYRSVLQQPFPHLEQIERAKRPRRLPTVFTRDEVHGMLTRLTGMPHLMARCLFRKSGTSAWRGKRPARVGGHPATLARTHWIPAYAGMTQPTRNPTDWQCIYEMDI